ncbi:hypothetical protein HQ585_16750 [candidate division KSB1 bacterium]|nr:hypothetical protein [candidate division KSB1 bacterium]
MAHCSLLEACPFFNDAMKSIPGFEESHKAVYCKGEFIECARYRVFSALGKEKVPIDLFPVQLIRAKRIIDNDGE